jgi:glutathione S-transferase
MLLQQELLFPALATIIAIIVYFSQSIVVAIGRSKHGVPVPKTMGHNDDFDRKWRVHYNTLEQMPVFLPLLWIFSLTSSPLIAGWLGIAWSVGRIGYMVGYYKSAKGRSNPIAYLSSIAVLVLLIGSIWSVVAGLLR